MFGLINKIINIYITETHSKLRNLTHSYAQKKIEYNPQPITADFIYKNVSLCDKTNKIVSM